MAQAATATASKIRWIDLSTKDAAGARDFYGTLFGWDIEVNPDPQYGGYALARIGGQDVAGIGPAMSPDSPRPGRRTSGPTTSTRSPKR